MRNVAVITGGNSGIGFEVLMNERFMTIDCIGTIGKRLSDPMIQETRISCRHNRQIRRKTSTCHSFHQRVSV
jgi:hypothetical protein